MNTAALLIGGNSPLRSWRYAGAIAGMNALGKALAALLLTLVAMPAAPARAQEASGISYINPFPEGDTYVLQAYGDQFAEGILGGLVESFAGDNRVQVSRKHRALSGIARIDFEDELKAEEASRDTVHIGVVMIGVGDRIHIRAGNRDRLILGSPEWREEYGRRVDRLIKTLKRRGIAIYWVGQPIMRRPEANDPAQMMNDIVRDKTYLNGIKFIDIQAHFADEAGSYAAYGPDITGKQRLLREGDGVLFTDAGNRKLAHFVEQEIKRDLVQAKAERAVPLAGSESEQKRVNASRARATSVPDAPWRETTTTPPKDTKAGQPKAAPAADTTGEQKADNGRITLKTIGASGREESVTLDILRPAIPAAVISLITRKETGDKPSQMGDVVADEVGGGVVVLSSITPAAPTAGASRRLAPSLSPYYQVLIKGEPLPSKPGRADDFTWPKVEYQLAPEPPAPRLPRSSGPKPPPRS
jgi:hypothetical protein